MVQLRKLYAIFKFQSDRLLGAMKGLQEHTYQGAYVLIGAKGLVPGQAIEALDAQQVSYP